jgi:hypothetical protein
MTADTLDERRRRETGYELQATLGAQPRIVGALAGQRHCDHVLRREVTGS